MFRSHPVPRSFLKLTCESGAVTEEGVILPESKVLVIELHIWDKSVGKKGRNSIWGQVDPYDSVTVVHVK